MATLSVRSTLTTQESSDQGPCLRGALPEPSCTPSLQVIKFKAMAEPKPPLPMRNLALEECSLQLKLTSVVGPLLPAVSMNSGEGKPMELWRRSHRFSVRFSPRKRFWRSRELEPTQEQALYLAPSWLRHGHWVERADGTHYVARMVMKKLQQPPTEEKWIGVEDHLNELELREESQRKDHREANEGSRNRR